jgi:hypothetical protein
MFEGLLKAVIFIISVTIFIAGIALSIKQHLAPKLRLINLFICVLITILLGYFAALGVIEACSDSKGYCRKWQVANIQPNSSFKPTAKPLRGSSAA